MKMPEAFHRKSYPGFHFFTRVPTVNHVVFFERYPPYFPVNSGYG